MDFNMTKSERIMYGDISPNHAMTIIGVDTLDDGSARKWKVENSWGTKAGKSGYWSMYDDWYDDNVLLIIVDKAKLDEADLKILDQKPIVIADWEPFFMALKNIQ